VKLAISASSLKSEISANVCSTKRLDIGPRLGPISANVITIQFFMRNEGNIPEIDRVASSETVWLEK
jgi:hypothetical protein